MIPGSIRRIAENATSLIASDVVNRATTFLLYVLVGRYLGAYEFGQMSLALTLFYLFQVIASGGLKTLITREVAKDRTRADHYLVQGSAAVLVFSLLSLGTLYLFAQAMGYGPDTATLVLLMGLALVPYSFSSVAEGLFQAWEEMRYIAYANASAHVGKIVVAFLLLRQGYGLYHLALVLLIAHLIVALVEYNMVLRRAGQLRWRLDIRPLVAMIRSTSPFLGIDGTIALMNSTNVVLLSAFRGETEVGLYSSSAQLLIPVGLLFRGIAISTFPSMARGWQSGILGLRRTSEVLMELMLSVALPAVVLLHFFAESILLLIYGTGEFAAAARILQIMSWTLVGLAVTWVMGQVLLVGMRERVTLRIVIVDAVVGLSLGLVLIPVLGVIGAAITALIVKIVDLLQHYRPASRVVGRIGLLGASWRPLLASGVMAIYLSIVEGQGGLLAGFSASGLYLGLLLLLVLWSAGGLSKLRLAFHNVQSG